MNNGIEKILKQRLGKYVIITIYYENRCEDVSGILREFNNDFIKLECEKQFHVINRNTCVLLMLHWGKKEK